MLPNEIPKKIFIILILINDQRLSGSSNSNSSGIASILDDYNPEVYFITIVTITVIIILETLNVFMNIPI